MNQRERQAACRKVAQFLREERENRDISMTRLAEAAGLSQQSISYVERGLRIPSLDTLLRISGALDVDLWKLIKKATA